jgi:hypothetical protein
MWSNFTFSTVWRAAKRTSLDFHKHILSINRPTKRRKENSRSDGHCQSEKEMEDHLLACQ